MTATPPALPVFTTERLHLRPRDLGDLAACVEMDGHPEVRRYLDTPWQDPTEQERRTRERILRPQPPGLGYWSIATAEDPRAFLGWILLAPWAGEGPEIEIGWRLPRGAWGRGYATEAAARILRHGFETLGLAHIDAAIDADNHRSIRVAERLGLELAGPATYAGTPCLRYRLENRETRTENR